MEERLSRRNFYFAMHIFLGKVMGLEKGIFLKDYARMHNKHPQTAIKIHVRVKTILKNLSLKSSQTAGSWSDFVRQVESELTQMSESVAGDIRRRFFIMAQDFDEFMRRVRKSHHEYLKADKKFEYVMLYDYLFDGKMTPREALQMFHLSISIRQASYRYAKLVESLDALTVDLQREFGYFHELYLYQESMIERFSSYEVSLQSRDHRRPPFSYPLLSQRLERFFKSQGIEDNLIQRAIFYRYLGIPKVSEKHLASLLEYSPAEVDAIERALMATWQERELITSVEPQSYQDLKQRFLSLTNGHLDLLRERLFNRRISFR